MNEMKPKSFAKLFEEAKKRDTYWVANAIYTFTEELHNMTEKKKITRTELARRMEVSPAYITKIFRGDVNFTIGTMVRLARRVGARLHLNLVQEGIEAYRSDWNFAYIDQQNINHAKAADGYEKACFGEKWGVRG